MTLAERASRGDRLAFSALLERHYPRIVGRAWRVTGRRDLAEDIAQDVCVKLTSAIKGYRGEARFTTWLYPIIHTTAIDGLRRSGREDATETDEIVRLLDGTGAELPADERLAGAELWAAVRRLSPKQRDAVLYVYGEEMSHAEAAELLNCSEATVSWHLHEARKRLKTLIES
ncbi:MAG TPA: RNA polymerase sigma factor [Hyphomicrobiaceae bacterium]|nr:RNA polymerase sigma factor [Hyphomicrobiaceae bacterium]